ncbi:MAG: hypothetical protein A4E28_01548 [Methanocella sp. PtaU1.Bin125]|nr:MAG: hypothetical protein A4E28_01548 [Methanocella sp. PtaU1.Bin125]
MPDDDGAGTVREKVLDFIRSKKGHIADLSDVLRLIEAEGGHPGLLEEMAGDGAISVSGDSVFLSSESYLPKVRCLICDQRVDRQDLVPFFREKHFPFVSWGFHKECLEGGARDEMIASGMFRFEDGGVYPAYEYGEGKNPVTIAIRFLRSEDFLYTLELKSDKE